MPTLLIEQEIGDCSFFFFKSSYTLRQKPYPFTKVLSICRWEHEWDRGGVWLRGYAARIGVATNLTAELWAWAVHIGLRIALARGFKRFGLNQTLKSWFTLC